MSHNTRSNYIMGNWKMQGNSRSISLLLDLLKEVLPQTHQEIVIFPPFTYLAQAAEKLKKSSLKLGAQTVCEYNNGAYTGEVSVSMLKDLSCEYILLGHSERRQLFNEIPERILAKFIQIAKAGLKPVLCIGETLSDYKSNLTQQTVSAQLENVLKSELAFPYLSSLIIAYEPVWAIGTGLTATPVQAQAVHLFIREMIAKTDKDLAQRIPIIYGGSIKQENAGQLFAMPDIDGGLVGGASLIGEEFIAICQSMKLLESF